MYHLVSLLSLAGIPFAAVPRVTLRHMYNT